MKAIRIDEYGGPDVLQLRDTELPEPGPGSVRVRLRAVGLNPVDIYQRRGEYRSPLPFTPGYEAAGIVEAVGEDANGFKPGDRVAYTGHLGAYAEAGVVPAGSLIPLPDDLSFEQGAAFPLEGMTAHYLIHEYRLPRAGDTVLIHTAAGGMGLLLVQWAKHLGARVIGTVSTEEKAQAARTAGADEVILYTKQDFVAETKRLTDGRGVDLIIDGVGKTTFAGSLEAVALRGHVVMCGYAFTRPREELMRRASDVLRGIREGWLRLSIDHVFLLADAAEAHRLLENRKSIGKIILKTDA